MTQKKMYPLMDPKVDFAFKQIFAGKKKENRVVLIEFLNTVLELEKENKIYSIEYLNPYTDKEYEEAKQSIMDVKVKTGTGEYIDIEIQIRNIDNYRKRALYYWASMYKEQMSEGEAYEELKKCIVISIINFDLIRENPGYHSKFRVIDPKTGIELMEDLEIHYLELAKIPDEEEIDRLNGLEQWLIFIKEAANEDKRELIQKICKKNEVIRMAEEVLETLSQDEKAREMYLQREKWRLDKISSEKYLRNKALKEGRDEGRDEGRQEEQRKIAINLIAMGMETDQICRATGLSKELIECLRNE
ncbi:MAG: Rpn family recombination-promoting nuclease/putative transposase [Syntrophomonadaceae bacterium]|nr:Rpn family recombination-promoting nuclease/putative transposase [Syntrophomonadaceae bacterium]